MKDQCDKIKDKLSAYLDGELSPDEMAEVAAHLETCPNCSALLEKMRRVDEMAETAVPDFDDNLMDTLAGRIMAGIDKPKPAAEESRPSPRVIPVWYRYVAVAASIVIVFLAGRMAFKESGGKLLSPPARYEMMTPAAEDTMMPYQESEGAAEQKEMAKPQVSPSSGMTQPAGEEKSAAATREKRVEQSNERQAPASETVDLPAPATIESPLLTEEPAAEIDHQPAAEIARKKSPSEPGKKSESPGKIAGRIVDAKTGEPLYGVVVQLKGTTIGAKSNLDGDFTILSVPPDTYDLIYSSPGYESMVYTGETEDLRVALKQSVLESGTIAEVRGTRKSIDFLEKDTGQKKTVETTAGAVAASKALADENIATRAALPNADSLDVQYASLLDAYRDRMREEGKKGMVSQKLSASNQESIDMLRKIVDSLDARVAETKNPAERIDVSYLRLRAALDLYRTSGKAEDKSKFESYEADFDRELSGLERQGYDPKTLEAYRSRIERIKRSQ